IAQTLRDVVGHLMLGLTTVQHAFADNMTMVTVGYPDSPLNGPSLRGAGPKPGHRLPPIAGQITPGSGTNPQFVLLAEPSAAITALIKQFGGLVDATLGTPPRDGGIWLIRPDGYVACTSSDANAVDDYMRKLAP
ncbi:MAG: hypothetical protein QOG25_590, partial [Acetobacteraceae bacterium]|nr:hypothetical protein [Acetobacteraceae bacterium]